MFEKNLRTYVMRMKPCKNQRLAPHKKSTADILKKNKTNNMVDFRPIFFWPCLPPLARCSPILQESAQNLGARIPGRKIWEFGNQDSPEDTIQKHILTRNLKSEFGPGATTSDFILPAPRRTAAHT